MPKTRKDYTTANRIAWNEAAPRHAAHNNESFDMVLVTIGVLGWMPDFKAFFRVWRTAHNNERIGFPT